MKRINELFLQIADKVSYAMGTPGNIIFWLVLVAIWFFYGPQIAKSHFLPDWFTSNTFNFPLNTVTTLAELFIGFLVAAAANRTERRNAELSRQMKTTIDQIKELNEKMLNEEITIEEDIKIQSTESNPITSINGELQ